MRQITSPSFAVAGASGLRAVSSRGTSGIVTDPLAAHVADEPARYSLTGIAPGYECVQDDTGQKWRYKAPSTAVAGYFVAGGTQDGIYTPRFLVNNRPHCVILGGDDDTGGFLESDTQWLIHIPNQQGGDAIYYSNDDVATPDLCSTWLDANTNQPVALTVTPVTQGELDAGCVLSGGDVASNGTVLANGAYNGRNNYTDISGESALFQWNDEWDSGGAPFSSANTAFPWQADWSGNSPAPTVTRNDVASVANWEVVS